jgi:hypothetical protein
MLGWKKSQPAFAAHQMLRTERVIMLLEDSGQFDKNAASASRNEFSHFPENIRASVAESKQLQKEYEKIEAEQGEKEAFRSLARQMGYEVSEAAKEQPKQVA